jgi:hypothetical protein
MLSHEAHHHGQILMLAQQVGYRLPDEAVYGTNSRSKPALQLPHASLRLADLFYEILGVA